MLNCLFYIVLLSFGFSFALPHQRPTRTTTSTTTGSNKGISVPLVKSNLGRKTAEQKATWLKRQGEILVNRYGFSKPSIVVRGSGTNDLVNHNQDSSYFGSLAIGTPAHAYNVILDTGSSDLWVAEAGCSAGCVDIDTFNMSSSSTYKNMSTPFDITYGSGRASGSLAQDTVQMAGFSVPDQIFGLANTVSTGLLTSPVSGLLGLGFKAIASSRATPFWQTLVENGAWDQPLMTFYLSRFINATHAKPMEPGGRFTMGFADEALYTGDIEYVDIPGGDEGFWILPLTNISVNGQAVVLPTEQVSAIDTGTTLIGGPSDVIQGIFADIPGSEPGTGDYKGYYTYPCDQKIELSFAFGSGSAWTVDPQDFILEQLTPNQCVGALFSLDSHDNSGPSWIMGDTFLKNVYSVFRYNPPSVGFATLSVAAKQLTQEGGNLPTPTTRAHPIVATGSATSNRIKNSWSCIATIVFSMLWATS